MLQYLAVAGLRATKILLIAAFQNPP